MMTAMKRSPAQPLPSRNTAATLPLVMLTLAVLLLGCDIPDRHDIELLRKPATWEDVTPTSASAVDPNSMSSLIERSQDEGSPRADWQFWYLHQIDPGQIIGGGVMQSQRIGSGQASDDQVKVTLNERTLMHFPPIDQTLSGNSQWHGNVFTYLSANEQTFWHAQDGRLLRTQCRVRRGPLEIRKVAEVGDDQIRFESDLLTSKKKKQLKHKGKLGGPLAVYQSLRGSPLAPREVRQSTVLLPIQESLANLRIAGNRDALSKRMTDDGLVVDSLHEAVALVSIDPSARRQRYYWYDDEGVVQATNITGDRRFTYRCTEKRYQQQSQELFSNTYPICVEVPGKPIPPGQIKQLALNIELSPQTLSVKKDSADGEPASRAQPQTARPQSAPRQYVQEISPTQFRVIASGTVVSPKKLAGKFQTFDPRSHAADVAATTILDFQSPAIRELMQISGSLNGMSEQEKAIEVNRAVHSLLSFQPLSVGIRPASEIASGTIADSTEHAILLIALLRAHQIPARMALGMKYRPGNKQPRTAAKNSTESESNPAHRFVYHAWVVCRADDQWLSLDPTSGDVTFPDAVALQIDDLAELDATRFVDNYLTILRSLKMTISGVVVQ